MPEDEALVAEILAGHALRFGEFVRRYQGPVFAIARSFSLDAGAAEDVAQDAFLAAFSRLAQFDATRGTFRAWLLSIARNRCRDLLRRKRPAHTGFDFGALPAKASNGVENAVHARLDDALARLSQERRIAFLLADVYDLPLADVAAIEDVPLGTIKSRLSRAREGLRAHLAMPKEPCDGQA